MTSRGRTLTLKVVGDVKDAQKNLKKAEKATSGFGKSIGKLGLVIGGAFAVSQVADFASETINLAADVGEATSKVEALFGDSSEAAVEFADTVAGYSRREALIGLGDVGNVLKGLDFPEGEAAAFSQEMLTLAADVGSFNNVASDDVLQRFISGLAGERDSLKALGIVINQAEVDAKAFALGLEDIDGNLTAAAKATATYELILEKTSDAQGDLARTSDSYANRTRELGDSVEDVKTKIGEGLLPLLLGAWDWIENTGIPLWSEWGSAIAGWWNDTVGPIISTAYDAFIDFVTGVVAIFQGEWPIAGEAFSRFADHLWEAIRDSLLGIWSYIRSLSGIIWNAMFELGRGMVNSFIRAWNSLDVRMSIQIPSWVPVVGGKGWTISDLIPDIPYLADGGIVNSPTLAMIGEAGPEAVVPLSGNNAMGRQYSITVNAGVGDPVRISEQVVDAIRYYERTQGSPLGSVGV